MSKRRRFRRSLLILLLVLILLGGAWTGIWYVVAGRLADRVAAWEQSAQAAGFTIRHDTPVRTGWPMAAGVRLPNLSVQGGAAYVPGGFVWTAEQVTFAIDIRDLDVVFIGVEGRQSLARAGRPPIAFQARRMTAAGAMVAGGRLGLVQAHASSVLAVWPGGGGQKLPVSIGDLAAAFRADGDRLTLAAQLHDIGLPKSHLAALGDPRLLSFDAVLTGAPNAAAGASLTLRSLRLEDGPLLLSGSGGLQMAAGFKPRGTMQLTAAGLGPALDKLAAAHVMTKAEARAMAAVTSLLAPKPGAAPRLPFRLDDGLVRLGPIPLFRWPQ